MANEVIPIEMRLRMGSMVLLLTGLASCGISAHSESGADCESSLLANPATWKLKSFESSDPENPFAGSRLAPIQKVSVREDRLFVQTYGSEPLPVPTFQEAGQVKIEPKYLVWLGMKGGVGQAAHRVQPYSMRAVNHYLRVEGSCSAPAAIEIEIVQTGDNGKQLGVVHLSRED